MHPFTYLKSLKLSIAIQFVRLRLLSWFICNEYGTCATYYAIMKGWRARSYLSIVYRHRYVLKMMLTNFLEIMRYAFIYSIIKYLKGYPLFNSKYFESSCQILQYFYMKYLKSNLWYYTKHDSQYFIMW